MNPFKLYVRSKIKYSRPNIYYGTIKDKTTGGIRTFKHICHTYGMNIKYIDSYCVWVYVPPSKYWLFTLYATNIEKIKPQE